MAKRFITFEGIEGAGKSTQIRRLAERLRREGMDPLLTHEPGGSSIGAAIRAVFLDPQRKGMDPWTELMLINADRCQHIREVIEPALEAGRWVLCDRYVDSTRAYQGGGRGLEIAAIDAIHRQVAGDLWPDLTLWLDVPVEEGLRRAHAREGQGDRMEQDTVAFHHRVREAFARLAQAEPGRIRRLDGRAEEGDIAEAIGRMVLKSL